MGQYSSGLSMTQSPEGRALRREGENLRRAAGDPSNQEGRGRKLTTRRNAKEHQFASQVFLIEKCGIRCCGPPPRRPHRFWGKGKEGER